jgi:hypothetical protein
MVVPTYYAYRQQWDVRWAWSFASFYILFVALVLLARFRVGKWKAMRVIEQQAVLDDLPASPALAQPAGASTLALEGPELS